MGYSIRLVGKNKIKAENLLVEVVTILNKHGIQYALEGGTLLGVFREQRLLPWDSDVDLSILSNVLNKKDLLVNDLKKSGYRVRLRYFENSQSPFKKGELRIIKIRDKSFFGLSKGSVCLEIFIKYPHKTSVYWDVAGHIMAAPKAFYDSYDSIDFLGQSFSIPSQTANYLTHKYGDWKKTVKQWNAVKDEKCLIQKKDAPSQ